MGLIHYYPTHLRNSVSLLTQVGVKKKKAQTRLVSTSWSPLKTQKANRWFGSYWWTTPVVVKAFRLRAIAPGRYISRICKKSNTFTGDTLKQAIKFFGIFLLIIEGISQLSIIPHHKPQKKMLERSQRLVVGCVLSEQLLLWWRLHWSRAMQPSIFLSGFLSLSLSLNVSVCLSDALSRSLSGTKPRRTLGAGAAHFDAWLSLYHWWHKAQ